jgi:hypothetical protein
MRHIFFIVCVICGAIVAWLAQPYVHDNGDAKAAIVTVLTVLAGFMIAIITVLGDPAAIPDGSWRTVAIRKNSIEHRIIRHAWLFVLYLLAIAFLFAGLVVGKVTDNEVWSVFKTHWELIKTAIDYVYIFLGVTSFLLSFGLPFSLRKIQMDRLKIEEERRKKASLKAEKDIVS